MDEELEKEIMEMCDIGLLYEEHGREQGRNEGVALGRAEEKVETKFKDILSMMNKLHYSLLEAMKILDVDESEYPIYEEKYNALKH